MIRGKRYRSDIIIFPDRVLDGWWRRERHRLHIEDLKEVLNAEPQPEVLIVGTLFGVYESLMVDGTLFLRIRHLRLWAVRMLAIPTGRNGQLSTQLLL